MDQATLRPYFNNFPLTLIFFVSLLTMGSFAAERKNGTLELLLSLPVSKSKIVFAKLLSVLLFFVFTLIFTLPNVAILLAIGKPDLGPIISSYLATLFLVSFYGAIGLFISLLSKDQIVSFLITVFVILIIFFLGEDFVLQRIPSFLQNIFDLISPTNHFLNFIKGTIYLKDVIYFVSLTAFFIYLSVKNLTFSKNEFLKI